MAFSIFCEENEGKIRCKSVYFPIKNGVGWKSKMSIWNYNLDFMIFFYKRFRITCVFETKAQMIRNRNRILRFYKPLKTK